MNICVIGLGEIGAEVYGELNKQANFVYGVDINKQQAIKVAGNNTWDKVQKADVYIICAYLTEQVLDIVKDIKKVDEKPFIIIEATIKRGTAKEILNVDLVLFPHRFNPGDPVHHVFNLDRIYACNSNITDEKFLDFIVDYMDTNLLHKTTMEIAEIAKPIENAIRFVEIALAEDLKMACEKADINFNELRRAVNTKWNIDVKEARDGVGGKCLSKDTRITLEFLKSEIMHTAEQVNIEYMIKETEK